MVNVWFYISNKHKQTVSEAKDMSSFIRSDSFMLKDVNVIIQRANKNWIYSCSQKNHQIVNIILPNQSYTKEEDIKSRWVIFCIGLLLWHDDSLWYRPSLEPKKAPPGSLFNLLCLSVCLPYITQPFFIGKDWNLAWWLSRFKLRLEASITYYVSQFVFPIYFSHFSSEWTEILHDYSLDGIDQAKSQKKL